MTQTKSRSRTLRCAWCKCKWQKRTVTSRCVFTHHCLDTDGLRHTLHFLQVKIWTYFDIKFEQKYYTMFCWCKTFCVQYSFKRNSIFVSPFRRFTYVAVSVHIKVLVQLGLPWRKNTIALHYDLSYNRMCISIFNIWIFNKFRNQVILIRSDCIKVFHFIPDYLLTCIHLCETLCFWQYFYRAMDYWLHCFCGGWEGCEHINWFNHTSWVDCCYSNWPS